MDGKGVGGSKKDQRVPLFYHEKYGDYGFGKLHPFNPGRFPDFIEMISDDDEIISNVEIRDSPRASDEVLSTVHSKDYIEELKSLEESGGRISPDTPVRPGAVEAARRIVGGSLESAKEIEKGEVEVNLGGLHHAGRSNGEGFCLLNDVAVAAKYLIDKRKKVCIFDTDAHNGNGTMDIFEDSSDVLFISIHQDPRTLYPGQGYIEEIGKEDGKGFTINLPMPRDANISDYHHSIKEIVKPVIELYQPDILIRNGGSDPHHSDSLTDLALDMDGLEYLGRTAREMRKKTGAAHIDMMLSGYGSRVIEGWKAILKGSLGLDIYTPSDRNTGDISDDPKARVVEMVEDLKELLDPYWKL